MKIKYLKHNQIDKKKWDACIEQAENGLIYAYSWYLDILSKNWDALIYEDYSAVMPLTWKKKYGIKYLYQPVYVQQSGVFFKQKISDSEIENFINHIPLKFKKVNINLNFANISKTLIYTERINSELKLSESYNYLYQNFNKNTKRNIKKAEKENLKIEHNATAKELIKFKKRNLTTTVDNDVFVRFEKLINYCKQNNYSKIYLVRNTQKELISAIFFTLSHNRAYYIFAASNKEGKEKYTAFFLINQFLKDYEGTNLILDFEGSMIPGVARFFEGWGAVNVPYYNLKQNSLPLFLRFLKK